MEILSKIYGFFFSKKSPQESGGSKWDIKNILIAVLSIALIVCFIFWYFSPNSTAKENKMLKNEVDHIQSERNKLSDSIQLINKTYQIEVDSLLINKSYIKSINDRLYNIESNINFNMSHLKDIKDGLNKINTQINYVEKNPTKKNGSELLNSLTQKIN